MEISKDENSNVSTIDEMNLEIMKERDIELERIQQDTKDLQEINLALAGIITEQGKSLNEIEEHMETVIIDQEKGLDCLSKQSNWLEKKYKALFVVGVGAASAFLVASFATRRRQ